MSAYDDRRETMRKTMLLEKMNHFEIQMPNSQLLVTRKSCWQRFRSTFCFWTAGWKKKTSKNKVFISEEERTYSKLYDRCYFISSDCVKKSSWQRRWELIDKYNPPWEPDNNWLLGWYFMMLIVLWIHLFEIPLVIFFGSVVYNDEFSNPWSIAFNFFTVIVLIIDGFFKLNTAYYREGHLETRRKKILSKYFRLCFWLDALALTVLIIYMAGHTSKLAYLKLLFYVKCYDIWHYDNQIQKGIELHVATSAIYKLCRIIIIFVIYSHWMGCGFFAIDYYLYNHNSFYLQNNYLWLYYSAALPGLNMVTTYSWPVWYEYGLYWALQTATTVGYGDITPKNPPEVLYTIVNMIAMCVMFAYFINSVWEILGDLNMKSTRYRNNFNILNRFLNNKNVSAGLRQKLRAYLDYLWRQDTVQEVDDLIISKLTPSLKDELAVNIRYPFFIKVRLFSILNEYNVISSDYDTLKKELAHSLKQERYSQGQHIFQVNDQDCKAYYLLDGKVKIHVGQYDTKGLIDPSENFGQLEFITGMKRLASATAIKYSHVYYLDRDVLLQCLKKYQSLYELFLKCKDQVLLYNNYQIASIRCFNCFEDHSFVDCPSLHHVHVYKPKIIRNQPSKGQQARHQNYRRPDFRVSKMVLPISRRLSSPFQQVYRYISYWPEMNIQQISI